MKIKSALFLVLLASYGFTQDSLVLRKDILPDLTSMNVRHFGNEELWGYINGGADIYLEYGFEEVTVFDIVAGGISYKADVYRMHSPEAAFGIYSIFRYRCRESAVLTPEDCLTPHQYIAACGNYFLSVSNTSGTSGEQEAVNVVAAELLTMITGMDVEIPELFSHKLLVRYKSNLRLLAGPLAMQNGFVRWDALFSGIQHYQAWVLSVKENGNNFYLADVRFADASQREAFLIKNGLEQVAGSVNHMVHGEFSVFLKDAGRLILCEGALPGALSDALGNDSY